MFDLEKGDICLCHSDLAINSNLSRTCFEANFSELIIYKDIVGNKYTHYYCWLDIENDCYIYASITFCDDILKTVCLSPQHQSSSKPISQPDAMQLEESQHLALKWYNKYFDKDEQFYKWGKIKYFKGNDPIYNPTCVFLEYWCK